MNSLISVNDNMIKAEVLDSCPLCNSKGFLKFDNLKDLLFMSSGEWGISQCLNVQCGCMWLSQRPVESEIHKAYQSYYTHSNQGVRESKKQKFLRQSQSTLIDIFLYITGFKRQSVELKNLFLEDGFANNKGHVLEIGCGDGSFLSHLKNNGWSVTGTDFDLKAALAAKEKFNISVHTGQIDEIGFKDSTFDVVIMKHVVEHLYNPASVLKEINRILKPEGKIIIVTPNCQSFGLKYFKKYWRGLEPPRHIILYSVMALKRLLANSDFIISRALTTSVNSWIFMSESFEMIEKDKLSLRQHQPQPQPEPEPQNQSSSSGSSSSSGLSLKNIEDGNQSIGQANLKPKIKNILKSIVLYWPWILILNRFNANIGDEIFILATKKTK